jgi:NhaA family Na+:H+ antiporter
MLVLLAIFIAKSYDIRTYNVYVALGVLLWLCVYESGVHATIAGVLLAIATPAKALYTREEFEELAPALISREAAAQTHGDEESALRQVEELARETESPLDRLTHLLHPWVGYVIVPIFALANAGVVVSSESLDAAATSSVTAGVVLGLVIGKPIGITLFSYLAVRTGLGRLPSGVNWTQIFGAGLLGGVGFTVALFITELAFTDEVLIADAKVGILAASIVAGVVGYLFLHFGPASHGHHRDEAHT